MINVITCLRAGLVACLVFVTACDTTPDAVRADISPSNGLSGDRYVGVLAIEQSMQADRAADQNKRLGKFAALYSCKQSAKCIGVHDEEVTLIIRHGQKRIWEQQVLLQNGEAKTLIPGELIKPDTGLCVQAPASWGRIARQEFIPAGEEGTVCTGDIYPYFSKGRGMDTNDAYGVSAIKPRGAGS